MRILIIVRYLEVNIKSKTSKKDIKGISRSITNILESLRDIKNSQIKVISQRFWSKPLRYLLNSYSSIPKIIRNISQFKPNIIIAESRIAFPSILISKIMKIPVIHIIRAPIDFCPKYVNIIEYGKACSRLNNRKKCFKCINNWRSLRVLIGNKPKGSEHSVRTSIITILYKIRYFLCLFNLYLTNKANVILVASELMKKYFLNKINQDKIKVINITPIQKHLTMRLKKKKQLVFIRTHFDASHKGLDFILRLSKFIPEDYKILIIGGNKDDWKGEELYNIINLEYITSKTILNRIFAESKITLVPTFFIDTFGRIIPESLTNKTPVISSPQCGANQFFKDKEFLKVIPLKLSLWTKTIKEMIKKPPIINNNDINQIYNQFSLEKNKIDIIETIKEVLINA